MNNISFNKFYRKFNILSLILILISLVFLIFKGLNYGVDFKGGTLIELRTTDKTNNISLIRDSFNQMNLGDVSVKKFGNETDFIVKFEKQNSNDPGFSLGIRLTDTDADANFLDFEEYFWNINDENPEYRLFADDQWHDVTISFSNSSLEAVGNYFQVFFNLNIL